MITKLIQLGDKVEIRLAQQVAQLEKTGISPRVYKSQINDVKEDGKLEITMPIENGKVRLLPLEVRYEFIFYTASGLYTCIGQIKERYKQDNIYVLLVEFHSQIQKYQRREYYRYPCLMDVKFYTITEDEAKNQSTEEVFSHLRDDEFYEKQKNAILLDLSGGGVRIVTEEKMSPSSFVLMILKLSNETMDKQHFIMGHVLSSEAMVRDSKQFETRIQFIFQDDRIREEIIQYIFEEERKGRNRK